MKTSKLPAKRRAFAGLAGSPLARILKQSEQKSDHVLRIPKTPDRQDPIPFDVWFDGFGKKHGQIDLDCGFQEYAFDPQLSRCANPLAGNDVPSHAGAHPDGQASLLQDLGIALEAAGRKSSVKTGLLEGDREIKRRRPGAKSWWVFDIKLLREFLRPKYDPDEKSEAEKAAFVLYHYYYENYEDEDIWEERSFFRGVKEAKQYRQFIVKQGAELFASLKPESTWHGRREVWRGFRCIDPNCTQCKGNEVSQDYSGRSWQ